MQPRSLRQCLLAAVIGASACGGTLTAAPVVVNDFSFEQTILNDGTTGGVSTNWSGAGNGGYGISNPQDNSFLGTTGDLSPLPAPADGTNYYYVNLGFPGYLWQGMGTLQPNTIYTLTVAVGHSLASDGGVGKIAFVNGVNPFGTFLASTPVDSTLINPGEFADSTLTFTTGQVVSGPLTILLQGDSGTQLIFDNVRLDATAAPQSPTTFVPTASPSNTVYSGTLVTLSENPAGAVPCHFQWQTDNGTGSTFSNIPGATSTNYVVNTSGFGAGAVHYRVVVTNSFGASTSDPISLTAISGPPIIKTDLLPRTAYEVVGSQITFKAVFDGSLPITYKWQKGGTDIAGATNSWLTLTNLVVDDEGTYTVEADNALGSAISVAGTLSVGYPPDPVGNVITTIGTQLGAGGDSRFTPTWTIDKGSLIAGLSPISVGPGNFSQGDSGVVSVLTDGSFGTLYPAGNGSTDFITAGPSAGQSVTYNLPASATGYDLTKAIVYGGWSDAGRDAQKYTLYYSTVASPSNFNAITMVDYNPPNPNGVQSAVRSMLVPASTDPLARNVAAVKFDFEILDHGVENGFAGYCEFQVFGVPSAPKPVLAADIAPSTGSDVVGSQVTFTAAFSSSTPMTYQWMVDKGSGAVSIPGARTNTLTLSNLQLTDTGIYSLKASNPAGTVTSSTCSFTVNPLPDPDGNGVIVSPAAQTGTGAFFTPTWVIPTNSLIAGAAPSSFGTGNFKQESCSGLPVLTDGVFGRVGSSIDTTMASCGNSAGHSITYTLTGSASGYDLSKIVTYGGWSDGGRDEQAYTVYYATVASPMTWTPITSADFNPILPGSVPTTDRVTLSSPTAAPLANNVIKVLFDFTSPGGENGYSGYSELAVFGTPSAALPIAPGFLTDTLPTTASDVVGSQVTFTASVIGTAPLSFQWQKDGVPIDGATNSTLTLTNLQQTDSASYGLFVSNKLGTAASTPSPLTVNAVPGAQNDVVIAVATQTGFGTGLFTPTWTIAPKSLIAGFTPSSIGSGNIALDGSLGAVVATDGSFGGINPPGQGSAGFITCGNGGGAHSLVYTLTGAGYALTNIVVYGGWSDGGRDQQAYTVSYSTLADPATFISLGTVNYNPSLPQAEQSATRVSFTTASGAPLASGVSQVKFDFTNPGGENGYSGYAEIGIFGYQDTIVRPVLNMPFVSGGNLMLTGTGGTAGSTVTWLTSTNVAAAATAWTTNTTTVLDSKGSFSISIPVNPSEGERFFKLK